MAILDTAAVLRSFGDVDVMRDQLGHLLEVAEWPHVHLRVTSERLIGYGGVVGGFTVMQTPTGDLGFAQEQAIRDDEIGIRDSKAPGAGHLTLTPHAFANLVTRAKLGRLPR